MIQDIFNSFYTQNNGKPVEKEDASNPDQCMDLIFAWVDVLGITRETVRHQFAYQVWQNPLPITTQYFDLIANGPLNTPQVGDIIVFGTKVGPSGHVSIETGKSNMLNLVSFDQNWDTIHYNLGTDPKTGILIPYCRLVTHTLYNGVLGWLHPHPYTEHQALVDIKTTVNSGSADADKVFQIKQIIGKAGV